jgi:hypothetical protein
MHLTFIFKILIKTGGEEPRIVVKLEDIVEIIEERKEEIFRHDPSESLRDRVYKKAVYEVGRLEQKYSLDQHLVTLGYCCILSPAVGNEPNRGGILDRFRKSTEGKPQYVLIFNGSLEEEGFGGED